MYRKIGCLFSTAGATMADSINYNHKLGLGDGSPGTFSFFISNRTFHELRTELDRLRQELATAQAELYLLQEAKKEADERCERYRLYAEILTQEHCPFTEQELADFQQNGVPAEQVLSEVEAIVAAGTRSTPNG